ncbi:helix-turn-helix transcriptional regulator [Streptomyces sp. NPDC096048]|uniref:helix-turn-helix transcriptional regulator n=1 Tax=Streptomyces sp. NPDC096048 TaxID=3366072 RepID=UPI00381B4B82
MTTTEIAAEHGVSRQSIHAYRRAGAFPQPVEGEGSTRPRFREDEVAAYFAANPPQPGKKRGSPPKQQGAPVTTTTDPRIAILSDLNEPPYNEVAEKRCVPWDEAEKMLDAYRASVVAEVVEALQAKAGELSTQAEAEMRSDLEEKAQVWHEAADVARKLKRRKLEAQDG